MFETLKPLTEPQVAEMVQACMEDSHMAVLVDPMGIYMLFTPTKADYGMDFAIVARKRNQWVPYPMLRADKPVIEEWTRNTIQAVSSRWKGLVELSTANPGISK